MKRQEVLSKIRVCELKKDFSNKVENFDYDFIMLNNNLAKTKKGLLYKLRELFLNVFIVKPFAYYIFRFKSKTKVVGKKNIKKLKKAVVSSNHVYKLDYLLIKKALSPHKTLAFDFNAFNKNCFDESLKSDVSRNLEKNKYIIFYPEESMWYMYEKPRAHNDVCYEYAYINNVPVISLFITFKETTKMDNECLFKKKFIINILNPIYPDILLNKEEAIIKMKKENQKMLKKKYEDFYQKDLIFEN